MIMKTRMTVAALACAATLGTAGGMVALASQDGNAGTARAAAPAANSVVSRCDLQNLSAGLHGFQAGLGNRGLILTLANVGDSSCTLDGYPSLGLESGTHRVLPSHTTGGGTYFDHDPGPSMIVLSPGEIASADVAYSAGDRTSSDSVATYLEVTPPNAHRHLSVRILGAPVRIYHGNLFVTAPARHTPY